MSNQERDVEFLWSEATVISGQFDVVARIVESHSLVGEECRVWEPGGGYSGHRLWSPPAGHLGSLHPANG